MSERDYNSYKLVGAEDSTDDSSDGEELKTRLVRKSGKFNIKRHVSFWKLFRIEPFNTLLNMKWYILILLSLLQYTLINLLFTLLYIVNLEGIGYDIGSVSFL